MSKKTKSDGKVEKVDGVKIETTSTFAGVSREPVNISTENAVAEETEEIGVFPAYELEYGTELVELKSAVIECNEQLGYFTTHRQEITDAVFALAAAAENSIATTRNPEVLNDMREQVEDFTGKLKKFLK